MASKAAAVSLLLATAKGGGFSAPAAPAPTNATLAAVAPLRRHATPPGLAAHCSTVYTSSTDKYELPYRVDFSEAGAFRWWAPMLAGGEEVGLGVFLSEAKRIDRADGSWEVGYFSANRFKPGTATNCCCEYQGQPEKGGARVLADYCVATVPDSAHLPMEEVCAPYARQCPRDNATALAEMGDPFIEIYTPCEPLPAELPPVPRRGRGGGGGGLPVAPPVLVAMAALVAVLLAAQLFLLCRRSPEEGRMTGEGADAKPGVAPLPRAGGMGLWWLQRVFVREAHKTPLKQPFLDVMEDVLV